MITKDILWKGIIEDLFEDFLHFFYPDKIADIDFSKPFVFLDKELQKIQPENDATRRFVDKLVKIFLKNGQEEWMLIHIEVQGYTDKTFAERMFIYYYRIFEKFQKSISALAIYTDDNRNFHPKEYSRMHWNTGLKYFFDTYKLLDKKAVDFDKFAENPFSIVMKTAWIALQKKRKVDLLNLKLTLARQLMKSGYSKKKTNHVLNFVGHYLYLDKSEEKRIFETEIELLTTPRRNMGIIESIKEELKRQAIEEGREEGLEQGLEQGESIGKEKGVKKAQAMTLVNGLDLGLTNQIIAGLLNISMDELPVLAKELINDGYLDPNKVKQLLP